MSDTTLRSKIADRPRLVGALFTIALLLAQAGSAAAGATATYGP